MGLTFPAPENFDGLRRSVGMDDFYSKLAQYVRLAESGEQIQITRWGTPVATLALRWQRSFRCPEHGKEGR
jgi:antitoxin (DNA-binding transcriptional repressor) of toxin-antitoxin stability system